ncbi:MAG: amidohydrolase [Acidobacteriota bacterium]|nr:MAG: amidohydrolase [Acidobacteriota bacterium]
MKTKALFLLLVLLLSSGCSTRVEPADLVLTNGRVVTMDPDLPDAEAIAIVGSRIAAVGTIGEIEPFIGEKTRTVDLEGRLAIPGLIEGHGHFLGLGQSKLILDLTKAMSWEDIVEMVQEAVAQRSPGEWILGRGWHQEKWNSVPEKSVKGLPLHDELSAVSPTNPVLLEHASGHAVLANAKAMELAGVTSATRAPEGGAIVRDGEGRPIGVFRETAAGLIDEAFQESRSELSEADLRKDRLQMIDLATKECLKNGITSFQDTGASFVEVDVYRELAESGSLGVRLYVMLGASNEELASRADDYRMIGHGDGFLTVRSIKCFSDGALGSHGAWLLKPYDDLPESSGLNTTSIESLRETARIAAEKDLQLCIHAIGDRANREVLDIYEEYLSQLAPGEDRRWRIEHAQHLDPEDVPRFAELGVIAAMQGVHATSDGPWIPQRLGEERSRKGSYVWRDLLDSGAVIVNGTDAPVENVNPIASFYASVSRRMKDGNTFYPEQAMTREEALRSYTLDAAYGAFEEEQKGSLKPGKLADITVLSKDILTMPEEEIPGTQVVYTIVDGKVVYERGGD